MSQKLKYEMVQELVDQIVPILYGHGGEVQGAALADLLSMWLAGHHVPGDTQRTEKIRREMLEFHVEHVLLLIPINEAIARSEGKFPPCPPL